MSTIFGEEHFFDKSMISIIEERGNAIDNFIYDEIAGVAKYELPMPKIIINREKVKKWLILCSQLENLEHSELIDMATKKKFADKDSKIQELKELIINLQRKNEMLEANNCCLEGVLNDLRIKDMLQIIDYETIRTIIDDGCDNIYRKRVRITFEIEPLI